MNANYTDISHLISPPTSQPKEAEPIVKTAELNKVEESVEKEKSERKTEEKAQIRAEVIKLPESLKKIGLQAAETNRFSNLQNVILPISDDKVLEGLHAPITSALRWVATLAFYLLKKARITLKVVHGHAVRMIKK